MPAATSRTKRPVPPYALPDASASVSPIALGADARPPITPEQFLQEAAGMELIEIATEVLRPPLPLATFVEGTSTITCEPWQQHLCARLEKLATQKGQRLLVHKPPQTGGSLVVSQRLPAYLMGRNPNTRVRQVTHNQTHSEMFSEVVQSIIRSAEYKKLFPRTKIPKQTNLTEWSTLTREAARDAQPSYMALGISGSMVGVGGDTYIVDDPYANFEDAKSPLVNNKIWDWHKYLLMPRVMPESNVVVMFHRFHPDDYAGRLLAEGGWEELRYSALAEENDPFGREVDEPLSPRLPYAYLDAIRTKDPLVFAGLYQGRPSLPEGNSFKRAWYPIVTEFNEKDLRNSAVYFDLGASDALKADRTVGTFGSRMSDGSFCWWWQMSGQWNPATRDREIEAFCMICNAIMRGVPIYLEAGIGLGVDSVNSLRNRLIGCGLNVKVDKVHQSKFDRATAQVDSFRSASEAKRIKLYNGNHFASRFGWYDGKSRWIEPFLLEICRLQEKYTPRGIEYVGGKDDRLDSGVGLHNKLTNERQRLSFESVAHLNRLMG